MGEVEDGGQVDVDRGIPLFFAEETRVQHLARAAGIVDEDIDRTDAVPDPLHAFEDFLPRFDVQRPGKGLAAPLLDQLGDLSQRRHPAAGQNDGGAFLGKKDRGLATDARSRSGDKRDLSVQQAHNGSSYSAATAAAPL
ncbi:UNVERIFIED_ORG: hypothetical protein GGD43_000814 [Rhizobium esperanzae]